MNARDISLLEDHIAPDRRDPAIGRLRATSERWPRLMLTRAEDGITTVAAVWMPDQNERYRRAGTFELEVDDETRLTGVEMVESTDPRQVAEEPPAAGVAEWESVSEIVDGEGNWI